MNKRFARTVSASLVVATTALSFPGPAAARTIGTDEALRADAPAATTRIDRESLRALFERDDVRRQLESYGVDARAARERVDALTDDEVQQLAGQVGALPAGGASILGVIVGIFVILLITDILGFTKVFPFTRSIR